MTTSNAPGRRAAPRRRRGLSGSAAGAITLLLLCGGLLASAGLVDGSHPDADVREVVPVDRIVNTCLGSPLPVTSRAATVAVPLPDASAEGTLETAVIGDAATGRSGPGEELGRGMLTELEAAQRGAALTVTAAGDLAVGRVTSQTDRARQSSALAAQECLTPRTEWWFTGGGAGLDHSSELVIANADPGRAVVDLVLHGPQGEVPTLGTRGVPIEPGEVLTFELLELAPQVDELAVHVEAVRGRVVAGLADSFRAGAGAPEGKDWIPAQTRASRVVRLAPLPRRADRRTLAVANPGDREVLVDVEVSGESGAFAPTDAAQLRVPPGAVVTADITDAVGRDASAVVLRSPVRVTGTVRSVAGGDVSYAAAVPSLTGPAGTVLPGGTRASVQLTAAGTGARVQVTAYDAKGEQVAAKDLEVAAGATAAWSPPRRAASVVVSPAEGRVAGGVVLTAGAGTTQLALRPLPVSLPQPAVVPVVR